MLGPMRSQPMARARRHTSPVALAACSLAALGLAACGSRPAASGHVGGAAPAPTVQASAKARTTGNGRPGGDSLPAPGHHASRAANGPVPPGGPARIEVVASVFPLAQLVSYIGGSYVHVTDLPGAGVQPQGLVITKAQRALIERASLVVDVGDGYQPEIEQAAAKARHHISLLPAVSKEVLPYQFWLDPALMSDAASHIAKALDEVDPAASHDFDNGLRDFQSVASSIESDFDDTLSDCSYDHFVTADDAFGRMAAEFDLVDVPVDTTGVAKTLSAMSTYSITDVVSEVGVSSSELDRVAQLAHAQMASVDPMELTPPPGTTSLSYFATMEMNLTNLEGPLACNTSENFY